jgi:hypothetical protein
MTLKELREFRRKHKRYPHKEEYDSIANSVISQLKGEAKAGEAEAAPQAQPKKKLTAKERIAAMRAKRRGEKAPAEEGQGPLPPEARPKRPSEAERQAQAKRIKDLLGEEEEIKALGEEDEEEMEEFSPLPGLEEEEEEVPVIEADKGKCSNCGQLATKKHYCPKCGSEFCDNCAAEKKDVGSHIKYKCPACGKEFKKKKY